MKKLFFSLVMFCSIFVNAQIYSDETMNSVRTITTNKKTFYSAATTSGLFFLKNISSSNVEYYLFCLNIDEGIITISNNSLIWFKCENGDIIKLENKKEVNLSNLDIHYIGSYGANPEYYATIEQIDSIAKGNINKIRIFTNEGFIDHKITNNKVSKQTIKFLEAIQKQKLKSSKNMDF